MTAISVKALGALVLMSVVALSACGSSPGKPAASPSAPSSSASVTSAPALTVRTALGTVGYRVVGSGPPLVLIMGYGGTMQTWDPRFVDALAQYYRVVVFDNAGVGSTQTLPGTLTIDAMADQTSALIDALHLGRPDVLGWSMGGMIAQALAVRHPAQVRRLVLCGTYPGTGTTAVPTQAAIQALTSGNPQQVMADLFPADQAMAFDAFTAGLSEYPAATPPAAATIAAQGRAILRWWAATDPAGRQGATISAPTLVADGAVDRMVPVANDYALAKLIPGARLVLYPDAGHAFLFQEGTPFIFLIHSFLTGPPAPLSLASMRTQFVADQAPLGPAGQTWGARLKALPAQRTPAQIAVIDQPYAATLATFDGQLLSFGATGAAAAAITTFVHAEETVINDVLALSVQNVSTFSTWETAITKDGGTSGKATAALRQALGLAPGH
jgi:pimeloyl-ACP methyl ester carboxylesterase